MKYLSALIQRLLLGLARRIYHLIPQKYRESIKNIVYGYGGFLFKESAAHQHWLNKRRYKKLATNWKTLEDIKATMHLKDTSRPVILIISHGRGGGTESHIRKLVVELVKEGLSVWALRMVSSNIACLVEETEKSNIDNGIFIDLPISWSYLESALNSLNLCHIHLHHTLDLQRKLLSWLPDYCVLKNIAFDVTIHDYFAICPRLNLTEGSPEVYCGEPEVRHCTLCISRSGSIVGNEVDVSAWRTGYSDFLKRARMVFVPNADVKQRMSYYFPYVSFIVRPHFETTPKRLPIPSMHADHDPFHVVTIGAISPQKGSWVLLKCAKDAIKRNLPIIFTIVGFTNIDREFRHLRNVTITGSYKSEELRGLIETLKPQIAFFPNVGPESYSYTLSEALKSGLYPVTLDIGAVPERLRALKWGSIWPLEWCIDASKINDHLLKLPLGQKRPDKQIIDSFLTYHPFIESYYKLDKNQFVKS